MFEHEIQEETFHKVKEYLSDLFEEPPYHDPETDHFYVRYGTTVLEISVEPYGPDEAMVTMMSYCVQDVEVEEDLLLGLLELNHQIPCGSFSAGGERHLLRPFALRAQPGARATCCGRSPRWPTLADDYDDRIVARYGGQTALEKIQDTGGRKKRAGDTSVMDVPVPAAALDRRLDLAVELPLLLGLPLVEELLALGQRDSSLIQLPLR